MSKVIISSRKERIVNINATQLAFLFLVSIITHANQSIAGNWNQSNQASPSINSKELKFGDFNPWQLHANNFKGGYSIVSDPLDSSRKVELFSIKTYQCAKGDCQNNSSRWEKTENVYDFLPKGQYGQPAQAWYSWEVYFEKDQAFGKEQPEGPIIMGQFKENKGLGCPHVAFWHYTRDDNDTYDVVLQRNVANTPPPGDCVVVGRKSLISIDEMRGKWTRFEFFIKWSLTNTGEAEGYVNGQRVFSYSGPNCFVDCDKFSNFRYGIYFANQRGGVKLRPLNVFYKNVRRSSTRHGLLD